MTTSGVPADDRAMSSRVAWLRLAALTVALATVGPLVAAAGPSVADLRAVIEGLGWLGPVVSVGLYALLTVLLAPGAALTIGVGLLFGIVTGTAVALLGAVLGSTIAFLIARHSTRAAVDRLLAGRAQAVDDWLADRGLGAVLTFRLVPLVPFSVANYAAGLTGIRTRHYLIGTTLGIVPGTVAYVAIGAGIAQPGDPAFAAALAGLAALTVVGVVALRRRRANLPPVAGGSRRGSEPAGDAGTRLR